MRDVLDALGLQAKNLRHRDLYFIRNVLAAFDADGKLNPKLHDNVIIALDTVDKRIVLINAKRTEKAANKKGKKKPPVLIPSVRVNPWSILNITLLDNLIREEPDISDAHPYAAVPAALAQGVNQQVYSDMQGFLRACKEYKKNPARFTGRPSMPGYLGKNSVSSFDIPLSRTTGKALPPIGKKVVACDLGCTQYLTPEQKAVWDTYKLGEEIERTASHIPRAARPKSLRVTFGKGRPKFVVVFDIDIEIPDNCLMALAYKKACRKAGKRKTKFGGTTQKKPTEEMLIKALLSLKKCDKVAGLDFGITNLLAIAFADGTKGSILAAARLTRKLDYQHKKLDEWKSANMPAALKALLSRRDKKEKLSRAECIEIRKLYREFYSHPDYVARSAKLARWCDDAFKKVASGVIKMLQSRNIEALVVGLNKGWKNGADMGCEMNRAFHGQAHSRILGMIRSAGEKAGILVVSVEESYTSKISFCNNVELKKYGETEIVQEAKKEECTETADSVRTKLPRSGTQKTKYGGQRSTKNRHVYRNEGTGEGKPANWRKDVHAEINGAYNILRKMFDWLSFNDKLSLEYDLCWLSPKTGLTPMNF